MALDDALRDMGWFAARGEVGIGRPARPSIELEVTRRAIHGETAHAAWHVRNAREAWLTTAAPGRAPLQVRVASRGQRDLPDLPVGRTIIRMLAIPLNPRAHQAIERELGIDVVYPEPEIEITVPPRVLLGDAIHLEWRVREAERVELHLPGEIRRVDPVGALDVRADECGRYRCTMRAAGPGGVAERRAAVTVVAPPVMIFAPASVSIAQGSDAEVRYRVTGAAKLVFKALDRDGSSQLIPMSGMICMDDVMDSERFVLTATSYDGRVYSRGVTICASPEPPPAIDDFLEILNGRLP